MKKKQDYEGEREREKERVKTAIIKLYKRIF